MELTIAWWNKKSNDEQSTKLLEKTKLWLKAATSIYYQSDQISALLSFILPLAD